MAGERAGHAAAAAAGRGGRAAERGGHPHRRPDRAVLPGLSDSLEQLAEVVTACVAAGAVSVSPILLHLRPGVREVFMPWLEDYRPDLAERYRELYPSSYASAGARARLSQAVDDIVDRCRRRGRPAVGNAQRRVNT